jgi:endogenous inhibitor of DNA gyrase (YacG/DUF329 family)
MVTSGYEFICPTCKKSLIVAKLQDLPTRPFCSERCKMVDLYKWFNEEITISENSTRPENEFIARNTPIINLPDDEDAKNSL